MPASPTLKAAEWCGSIDDHVDVGWVTADREGAVRTSDWLDMVISLLARTVPGTRAGFPGSIRPGPHSWQPRRWG